MDDKDSHPGEGYFSPKLYVDVPAGPRKSDFLYTTFMPNFSPISIPFLKEKHPILTKLGALLQELAQNTPNLCNLGSSISDDPPLLYQISQKSAPKGRQVYIYHVNVRTPPRQDSGSSSGILAAYVVFTSSLC